MELKARRQSRQRKNRSERNDSGEGGNQPMIQEMSSDEFSRTVKLPESLNLRAAPSLAANLLAVRGRHVTIDASNVEKVGAQCVQVLLSAQALWNHDCVAFTLSGPSHAFVEALETLGVPIAKLGEQEPGK
jgi:chemotaxis protein CheX